jgi:hypothetical protein
MTHPDLIATLADDRRRAAHAEPPPSDPTRLCRKCQARMSWRRRTTRTNRRAGLLRSIKIGKLRRITDQQLAEFIASLDDAARDVLGLLKLAWREAAGQAEGATPMGTPQTPKPKRRRERGDDGISWDKINKCYVGTISLGYDGNGKRLRRTVRGKTKQEVKDKLDKLHEEIKAGVRTAATYTVGQCVADWLDSLELDPSTMATYRGQAEKWIYPKLGAMKLKDFKVTGADRFFREIAGALGKSSLVEIKSTLADRSAERRNTISSAGTSPSLSTCRRAGQGARHGP